MEHTFTDDNFQNEVLKSDVPVLVDFWAPWCGPCRMMAPVIEELADEIDGAKLKIGKCNVDENPDSAGKFNVMSIPTFLVFKDGKVAEQFVGGMPKAAMLDKLNKIIG
ncbi:thioredoxin [Candidatus Uhrbacteria bacterium]|nr:thioredoxin [Candidatus Uhrbacteria bacterium]